MRPASRSQQKTEVAIPRYSARPKIGKGADWALGIGNIVTVFAVGPAGPYIEGRAVTKSECAQPHVYRVCFLGETTTRTRFIHPDWQAEPERGLALLLQLWRTNTSPPSFEDFFPDDLA